MGLLGKGPGFQGKEIWKRRLFRPEELGFPCCPAAKALEMGPEAMESGHEFVLAVGSAKPVMLRPVEGRR